VKLHNYNTSTAHAIKGFTSAAALLAFL